MHGVLSLLWLFKSRSYMLFGVAVWTTRRVRGDEGWAWVFGDRAYLC